MTSDPMARAHRYYMTAKNSCQESGITDMHRTMHLTINKGKDDATWNLIWNGYEGFAHEDYNVYRGTTSANMALLTTIEANGYNSFTDYNAPAGNIYYMIAIADGPACNPSLRTTGEGQQIASNIATNADGLAAVNWIAMNVWPNPASSAGTLVIQSNSTSQSFEARITDITGRIVEVVKGLEVGKSTQFGTSLAAGVYNIEVLSGDNQRMLKKWIKN